MASVNCHRRLVRGVWNYLLVLGYALPGAIHAGPFVEQPKELSLGRLFFSPQQRAERDRRRLTDRSLENRANETNGNISLNGVVRSSNSRITTWINGVPQPGPSSTISHDGNGMFITVDQSDQIGLVRLRAGQSLNVNTGERIDGLKGGRVLITGKSQPTAIATTP